MTDPRHQLPGLKPGDRRVLIDRPHHKYFRYQAPGVITAKLAAEEASTPLGRALSRTRRALFGRPLSNEEELVERLPKWKALPVFSSDVMSSVAYATEASLFTLLGAGTIVFNWLLPISLAIVGVLALVTLSYRQTIRAYPNGGGSYIVAHANLGVLPGLVAAAALLTDYVLTVAVSVSSGVQALYSLFPPLLPIAVPLIVLSILGVMAVNLRGVRESGTIFAAPTYIFLGSVLFMLGLGVLRTVLGQPPQVTGVVPAQVPAETFGLLLLMRAFADGCSAMTGTEAVANGVPAFKPPEWQNARTTMLVMATLLATMYLGTTFLAHVSGALPSASGESVLSQIGRSVYGSGALWYILQLSTMGILILAANTSFADFPRVASILAKDGYFPRQFSFRGERLAFNAGIVALAIVSIVLVAVFNGQVEALIPLYAIGVFTAFTLSQAGMVRHWFRERGAGWRRSAFLNGLGATTTAVVVVIFAIAKFALGAWIILVVVPVLVVLMLADPPRVRPRGPGSRREPRGGHPASEPLAAHRGRRTGSHPGRGAGDPGGPDDGLRRRRRARHGRSGGRRAVPRADRAPGAERSGGDRGVPLPLAGQAVRALSPGVAGRAPCRGHDRPDPRVRLAPLVGTLPVQPELAPHPGGPCRAAGHRGP